MSYHFLCKRGIRPARTEQFLVLDGWPENKNDVPPEAWEYWNIRDEDIGDK